MKPYKQHLWIELDGEQVALTVQAMKRQSMRLVVDDKGSIDLRVPIHCTPQQAKRFLASHHDWLLERRRTLLDQQKSKAQRIWLLGEDLNVMPQSIKRIQLRDDGLYVPKDWSNERRADAIGDWLRECARDWFQQRIDIWWPEFETFADSKPTLRIKVMKTRWGSLSKRGYINLNRALIHLRPELVDLVVVHELCHLKYFDHGKGFQRLMSTHIPDWRDLNQELDQVRFKGFSVEQPQVY